MKHGEEKESCFFLSRAPPLHREFIEKCLSAAQQHVKV
jgi:hypothetical protein